MEEAIQTKPLAEQITPLIQRQEEEEKEELLQVKVDHSQLPVLSPYVQACVQSLRGRGQPLAGPERTFFEPRFGHDFSNVRIHADSRAADTVRAVKARAFTLGADVVFGAGQFAPERNEGKRLLAHELTHVVQQGCSVPRPQIASVPLIKSSSRPEHLMRTITYDPDCSANQAEVEGNVTRAQASAARWARNAAAALAAPEEVASLLRRHFRVGADNDAAVAEIRGSFEIIAGQLEGDAFTYHCRPDSDDRCQEDDGRENKGFAYPGTPHIYFCDPFPFQNFFGHRSLIDTLLHEAAHAHNPDFNHDTYEHHDDYPGDRPLTNPDSYSSFARDLAFGRSRIGCELELAAGSLMAADPQFYIAVGTSGHIGGPAMDIFNLRAGARLTFMPGTETHPARAFEAVDIGIRINPIGQRVYVDLTTGAFFGLNITDMEFMTGIANRITGGYRGESVELGLDIQHLYDFVARENLVIVGVRGGLRF